MNPSALGCKLFRGTGAWLATLPPTGHPGLSLRCFGAGWLQDEAEPTWGSCPALRGRAPGPCLSADPWNADSAQLLCHSCCSSALAETLLCPRAAPGWVLLTSVTRPGRKVCSRELILLNLFCPQTMVRPLSCRQEGTSSPSPSSSLSKLVFLGGEGILKMRVFEQNPSKIVCYSCPGPWPPPSRASTAVCDTG